MSWWAPHLSIPSLVLRVLSLMGFKCRESYSSGFFHLLAVWPWGNCPLYSVFSAIREWYSYLPHGCGNCVWWWRSRFGKVPATRRRSPQGSSFSDSSLLVLQRQGSNVQFAQYCNIVQSFSSHLTHCPSGFEVSQAGGGLPIVKMKK